MSVIVYDGGVRRHYSTEDIVTELSDIFSGEIISDHLAQTIAAQWHSPRHPNSTLLSEQGVVMSDTDIYDFASQQEFDATDDFGRMCLRALNEYIKARKRDFLSRNPLRCPDCFAFPVLAYKVGETIREENGKQFTECQRCYSDLYRVWSKSRGWLGWEIVEED